MTSSKRTPHAVTAIYSALSARNLSALLDEVCEKRGVLLDEICGRRRSLAVALARHELWWRIRNHPERNYSYVEIGRLFRCDHTTIRQGVQAHEKRSHS